MTEPHLPSALVLGDHITLQPGSLYQDPGQCSAWASAVGYPLGVLQFASAGLLFGLSADDPLWGAPGAHNPPPDAAFCLRSSLPRH